jgi:hypothetical protein
MVARQSNGNLEHILRPRPIKPQNLGVLRAQRSDEGLQVPQETASGVSR